MVIGQQEQDKNMIFQFREHESWAVYSKHNVPWSWSALWATDVGVSEEKGIFSSAIVDSSQ